MVSFCGASRGRAGKPSDQGVETTAWCRRCCAGSRASTTSTGTRSELFEEATKSPARLTVVALGAALGVRSARRSWLANPADDMTKPLGSTNGDGNSGKRSDETDVILRPT